VAAVITLRDRSLYERLQKLLPRPDFPYDELLRRLIEQPGKVSIEKLSELERRMSEIEQRVSGLGANLSELQNAVKILASAVDYLKKLLESIKGVLESGAACSAGPFFAVLVPARFDDGRAQAENRPETSTSQRDAEAAVIGDEVHIGGGDGQLQYRSKYVQVAVELARASGGCVRYSELAKRLGMNRLSGGITELLLKNGFVRKEKGLYCLAEAAGAEDK
jgi:uncharacterized coiled-coil protein SlyX